jgi:hypothetical protein
MGLQDRDYWREKWNKQNGYIEKASFRKPEIETTQNRKPEIEALQKPDSGWHWSLIVVFWLIVHALLFAILSYLKRAN